MCIAANLTDKPPRLTMHLAHTPMDQGGSLPPFRRQRISATQPFCQTMPNLSINARIAIHYLVGFV